MALQLRTRLPDTDSSSADESFLPAAPGSSDAPLVSVIIPAHNAGRHIADAIHSALDQTYGRLEIIIVDDGSTDDTAEIVERIAFVESRLRLLRQSNAGVAAARNAGIALALGEFIAPLDADDVWHPDKIQRQLEEFERHGPEVGLVYVWTQRINEEGAVIARDTIESRAEGDVLEALIFTNIVGHASAPLIRRDCLDEVGGYDPTLLQRRAQGCEDLKLYLAIAERYHFGVVPEHLVGYRRSDGSMSSEIWTMLRSYDLVMQEVRARLPHLPDSLFRRSCSFFYCWLALQSVRFKQKRDVLKLVLLTLRNDPTFVCQRWFLQKLGKIARRAWYGSPLVPPTRIGCQWPPAKHVEVPVDSC